MLHTHSCFTSMLTKVSACLLVFALLPISVAHAMPFSMDITITGTTDFDEGFSFGLTTGDFGITEGGTTTLTTFTGSTTTGADPLSGTLTDIGDGLGFSGTASTTDDFFGIGLDTGISVTNSSATDSYEIVFELVFSNFVNADGDNAVVDSEITLDLDTIEVFFSDLTSDTTFGDSDGGISLGTFGDPLLDSGIFLLPIVLAPSATADLDLRWTVDDFSGDYTTSGLAELDTSLFLGVSSVTSLTTPPPPINVPAPGTLLLLCAGLLGLPMVRKLLQ